METATTTTNVFYLTIDGGDVIGPYNHENAQRIIVREQGLDVEVVAAPARPCACGESAVVALIEGSEICASCLKARTKAGLIDAAALKTLQMLD